MKDCLAQVNAPRPNELTRGELKLLIDLKLVRITRTTETGDVAEYELTHDGRTLVAAEKQRWS